MGVRVHLGWKRRLTLLRELRNAGISDDVHVELEEDRVIIERQPGIGHGERVEIGPLGGAKRRRL